MRSNIFKSISIISLAFCTLILTAGCLPNTGGSGGGHAPQTGRGQIILGVEQMNEAGQWAKIPVRNHTVTLRRRPFRIVSYFDAMGSMFVHASFKPNALQQIQQGTSYQRIFPAADYISEEFFNPRQSLLVRDNTEHNNWSYLGPYKHKFDPKGVDSMPKKGFLCRRTVDEIDYNGQSTSVDQLKEAKIHMAFVQTEQTSGGHAEKQRDWLTIIFK